MKYAFMSAAMLLTGMFGLVFIVMFESVSINNESGYYNLKETMKASMLESVDLDCFRNSTEKGCNGSLKISEQKFVENFTRRFAANASGNANEFELEFYDIIESPPKATVLIKSKTSNEISRFDGFSVKDSTSGNFDIVNELTGILEANDWEYYLSQSQNNT